jgi:hypothetical protein
MAFWAIQTRRQQRQPLLSGAAWLACALLGLSGCGAAPDIIRTADPVRAPGTPLIAVFPVENLSGRPAPLEDIRGLLSARLRASGLGVLGDAALENIVTKHRVRYTAGLEREFARALAQEAGVDGIVIPSLELYDEATPPRVALFARLVSTGNAPAVRWIDGTGMAGDDSPGILGIGLIADPRALLTRAVDALVTSLARHVSEARRDDGDRPGARKFRPKIVYRSDALDPARTYSVAVVPFFNKSERKYAGEIIALHMIRKLLAFPGLEVVEPGIVREELLRFRIIMSDGVSLPETETILNAVNADLVLNGEVLEYRDRLGPEGAPKVDFGLLFIERRTRRVVYSSYSDNAGDDRVFFFDWGRVNTAHALASQMAGAIVEHMLRAPATATISDAGQENKNRMPPANPSGKEGPR